MATIKVLFPYCTCGRLTTLVGCPPCREVPSRCSCLPIEDETLQPQQEAATWQVVGWGYEDATVTNGVTDIEIKDSAYQRPLDQGDRPRQLAVGVAVALNELPAPVVPEGETPSDGEIRAAIMRCLDESLRSIAAQERDVAKICRIENARWLNVKDFPPPERHLCLLHGSMGKFGIGFFENGEQRTGYDKADWEAYYWMPLINGPNRMTNNFIDATKDRPGSAMKTTNPTPQAAIESTPAILTNAEFEARGLARSRYHDRLFAAGKDRPTNEQFDEGWDAARKFYARASPASATDEEKAREYQRIITAIRGMRVSYTSVNAILEAIAPPKEKGLKS